MNDEADLLRAIVARPEEAGQTWLVLADWLDENARAAEAELIRLQYQPTYCPELEPSDRQARIVEILVSGVKPCVPTWTNPSGMRFVWCPPGTFRMGSPKEEAGRDRGEIQHRVTLTRGFWLGETHVTQAQWKAVIGQNPSDYKHRRRPVECVSYHDTLDFCVRLGQQDGHAYRLPTEAEWEYACRAGTTTPFFWGTTIHDGLVNYDANLTYGGGPRGQYRKKTTLVMSFPPNVWGLYDMHGNLNEWTADRRGSYTRKHVVDPCDPPGESDHISARGGAWFFGPVQCRSAARYPYSQGLRYDRCGCRIVAIPGK